MPAWRDGGRKGSVVLESRTAECWGPSHLGCWNCGKCGRPFRGPRGNAPAVHVATDTPRLGSFPVLCCCDRSFFFSKRRNQKSPAQSRATSIQFRQGKELFANRKGFTSWISTWSSPLVLAPRMLLHLCLPFSGGLYISLKAPFPCCLSFPQIALRVHYHDKVFFAFWIIDVKEGMH